MQSSAVIVDQQSDAVVASAGQEGKLLAALTELESLGFLRLKQNLRLLKKTNGDLDVVREYLVAKKKLHEVKQQSKKEGRECRRKEKFEKKREVKLFWKCGQRHKEEKIAKKEWKKSICGKKKHGCKSEEATADAVMKREEEEGGRERAAYDANVMAKTLPILNLWPTQVTRLYLDGNNMLYVAAPLRSKAIHRREMASAEIALSSFAFEFTKLLPTAVNTTMVFDSASGPVTRSYGGDNFQILSAKPAFDTSDDALVHWAKENAEAHVLSMVVTSDRGLQKRLAELPGVVLVKPKVWMEFAASMLENKGQPQTVDGPQKKINLDEWMSLWMQKLEEENLAAHLQGSLNVSNAN
jgi:hypothetical protein